MSIRGISYEKVDEAVYLACELTEKVHPQWAVLRVFNSADNPIKLTTQEREAALFEAGCKILGDERSLAKPRGEGPRFKADDLLCMFRELPSDELWAERVSFVGRGLIATSPLFLERGKKVLALADEMMELNNSNNSPALEKS